MKLMVNGEAVEAKGPSLADLLVELGKGNDKLATAVNEVFVPASTRATQMLSDGDRIELVSPRQGG